MLKTLKTIETLRSAAAAKVSKKVLGGESVLHFVYGVAIISESHELTFYSVSAFSLGLVSLVAVVIGGEA